MCSTRSVRVGSEVFPPYQDGSCEDRADTMGAGWRVTRLSYMGLRRIPSSEKLFHLHPILLPVGNKQLGGQFCTPVTAPNTTLFQFHSLITQQWHGTIGITCQKRPIITERPISCSGSLVLRTRILESQIYLISYIIQSSHFSLLTLFPECLKTN